MKGNVLKRGKLKQKGGKGAGATDRQQIDLARSGQLICLNYAERSTPSKKSMIELHDALIDWSYKTRLINQWFTMLIIIGHHVTQIIPCLMPVKKMFKMSW